MVLIIFSAHRFSDKTVPITAKMAHSTIPTADIIACKNPFVTDHSQYITFAITYPLEKKHTQAEGLYAQNTSSSVK